MNWEFSFLYFLQELFLMTEELTNNEISLEELLASFKKREREFIFNVRAGFKHGEAARAAGFPEKSADTILLNIKAGIVILITSFETN